MGKTRVHDLADEFGTTSEAILRLLNGRGFFVRSASSGVDAYAVEWLRFEFTVDQSASGRVAEAATGRPDHAREPERTAARSSVSQRSLDHDYSWGFLSSWRRRPSREVVSHAPPRRSTRAVPVFGGTPSDIASLDLKAVEVGLVGSPYSLPATQTDYLTTIFLPRVAALSIRARRESERISNERRATLRRITRSSEIYESNKIEGLGPDLSTTDRLLHAYDLHTRVDVSLAQGAIQRCLTSEPKVRDVVGLGAARLLAEIYCSDRTRSLTGSDIRQLHELVMVGDPQRGTYKRYVNHIQGSSHEPMAPSDTPGSMRELVDWMAATNLAPIWRAAVVHAWLTHIHPFHDGNGRIARLLANLVLIREGMPPLIVRASSDRGPYIDALAASDGGGNILPLARLFRRVLSRAVQDVSNPNLADQIFNDEVQQRLVPRHVRWHGMLNELLSELAPRLLLHKLNLYSIGEVTDAELTRIGSGYPENAWIAKVGTSAGSRDLLLHIASPTSANRSAMPADLLTPSIFVSVRNDRPLDARQYLPVGREGFTHEFTPLVDGNRVLVRSGRSSEPLPIYEAADRIADQLARTHRQLIGRLT